MAKLYIFVAHVEISIMNNIIIMHYYASTYYNLGQN